MPIHISWIDSQKKILHISYIPPWTWEEFYESRKSAFEELSHEQHPVCIVLDYTNNYQLPPLTLSQMQHAGQRPHPRTQTVYIVASASFVEIMAKMFLSLGTEVSKMGTVVTSLSDAVNQAYRSLDK